MSTGTCKAAVKAEFTLMTNQVFPYTEDGNKAAIRFTIENTSALPFTIYKNGTTFKFNAYPTVVFYPVIEADYILQPAIPPDPHDPDDPGTPGEVKSFIFMTDYTGTLNITSASLGFLYTNGTQVTTGIALSHGDCYAKENGVLYYFCFRMTDIFAQVINNSHISDPGTDENPGRGNLSVSQGMMDSALTFAAVNILDMQAHPTTSNAKITGTLDNSSGNAGYLDILTGYYFYGSIGTRYSYHPIRAMAENACNLLDSYKSEDPSKTSAVMNDISAELMAQVLDHYCNGALS